LSKADATSFSGSILRTMTWRTRRGILG
jgi:hypothetical protein